MSDRKKKIVKAIEYLQDYIGNYATQEGYESYSVATLIDDVLYGLGVALDNKYSCAHGYDLFKERLRKHLKPKKAAKR